MDASNDAADARIGSYGAIEDWVITRLRRGGQELRPLDYDWQDVRRARPEIVATLGYWVSDPAMWLLVMRFAGAADADAARQPLLDVVDRVDMPPYDARAKTSGAYLLIIGFASSKPVSPEMERHRDAYVSAFSRQE